MRTVLCMLLFMSAVFSDAQTVISLNDTIYSKVAMPRRNVEIVDDGIIVTYDFGNAIIQQDSLYPQCVMWKIPGFGLNEMAGEPAIPFRWDSFTLPKNTRINLEVIDSSFVDFSMQLSPARPVLIDSDTIGHSMQNVLPIAPYKGFFPTSLVDSFVGNAYRGVPLLDVAISSLQYNQEEQIVRAYKKIKYKITFLSSYRNNNVATTIAPNDNYLSITTINASSPSTNQAIELRKLTGVKQNRDYLIVTNSTLRPVVEEFAEWKRTLGFRTYIAVKDNWSVQAVVDTVANYYNAIDKNLYYLLIVGDEGVVPAVNSSYSDSKCVTDLHYACMDGSNDCVPDIYYGRIPINNTSEAEIIFDKILTYERAPILDDSFYETGLNCAYFQDDTIKSDSGDIQQIPDTYADRRFSQTSEEILQYVTTKGKTVNRVYFTKNETNPLYWNSGTYSSGEPIPNYLRKPGFTWNGGSTNIANHINEGAFYVLHRGHGTYYGWERPNFETNHIQNLMNSEKLPIVFSINCNTGRYHVSPTIDCFAEAFLKKENGGCVAIYAATGISFSGYNDALATGMFDAIWPEPGLRSIFPTSSNGTEVTPTPIPTYELGQILEIGMVRMQETWGLNRKSGAEYTRELFHLFGDPSMQIYTDNPTSIQMPEVYRVNNTIYVEVKDGDARISFYTPSTQQVDTFNGSNVAYQTACDDVVICISRHNHIPYITNASNNQVYIQNETINDDKIYSGSSVKIGRNVTDKKAYGDVVINSGKVNITGDKVELQSGLKVSKGAVLEINTP